MTDLKTFRQISGKDFYTPPLKLMKILPNDYVGTMAEIQERYGDLVYLRALGGMLNIAFISDPDMNREIYIRHHDKLSKSPTQISTFLYVAGKSVATAHGEDWRTKRAEANQLFSRQTIAALGGPQMDAASGLLTSQVGHGTTVKGRDFAKDLAAATTGRAILGRELNIAEINALVDFSDLIRDRFNIESKQAFARPDWMLAPWRRKIAANVRKIKPMIARAIAAMKSDKGENDGLMHHYVHGSFLTSDDTEMLTLMTGLLAGALDNIAAGVAWWLALIAHHPELQEKIAAEVAKDGLTSETLKASIQEMLRMRPPAQANQPRILNTALDIGGVTLPKGTYIMNSIFNMHQNADTFDDPDAFDVDRFADGTLARSVNYLPFGHGPRNCVAQGMASQQIAAIGAAVLKHYRIIPGQGTDLPAMEQNPFLVPAEYDLTFESRG